MDNDLKILADIVSSKKTVSDFNVEDSKLPQNYINLININKKIIQILSKMDPKPIKYELLGEFQKMFLLREDIKNKELKDNLDELSEIVSTEASIKKYEGEPKFPIIMNELIKIDKDIINILNEIKDSPINYDNHLGKIQKIFLTRGLKKKSSKKKKKSVVSALVVVNFDTIKRHLKKNIGELISCNDNKYTLKEILDVQLEEILDEECKKIIIQFLSGSIEYFYTKSFYKNEKSKAIRKAKKKLSKEEYNKLETKLDNIEKKIENNLENSEYEEYKKELENYKEELKKKKEKELKKYKEELKKKEEELKKKEEELKKYKKDPKKYKEELKKKKEELKKKKEELKKYKKELEKKKDNELDNELKIHIDFIKKILVGKKLTIKNILEILFLFNEKTYDRYFNELNDHLSKRSKYKKLLKDINYIKKYMKYKMKYYIMLKKNNLSN